MGKGRNNKAGKKTADDDREKEETAVPEIPVKTAADKSRTPSSSSPADVIGPFQDLLDLHNNADQESGPAEDDAEDNGEHADRENKEVVDEPAVDATEQGDDDAESVEAPGEDDNGYLSDDSDEHLEPDSLSSVIALKRFSLTLLVPISRKVEVKRAAITVAALLDDEKDQLSPDALQTTTYQELTATYFSGTRYGRLQVTFNRVRDANYIWNQIIKHECVNGDIIDLTWQHPEDARFLRERVLNPSAKEVVVKGLPADITAELIRHLLVVSKLVKRGRSAFASGFGFHRTVDPVTGLDTDRIRAASLKASAPMKRILKDPAVVLTSTGGVREEWVCVQTVCEKAQGNHFEQAAAHVASARHKGGLKADGNTTRASKHSQKMAIFKKEFIVKAVAK
ncbi:unnamed protein product [Closterium sp. Naga37s-1]|nr:unnamed protein product [Closterium sp. Naga37s-1]CAI5489123.1 unnamed protein product [Closterium sp. Naga37s-1]CAI5522731.1 unnamed protein product [Closterium sp. Naga37s-1]CAI5522732.1 unnamed protein product [Closterium sp. Naga37s-1]